MASSLSSSMTMTSGAIKERTEVNSQMQKEWQGKGSDRAHLHRISFALLKSVRAVSIRAALDIMASRKSQSGPTGWETAYSLPPSARATLVPRRHLAELTGQVLSSSTPPSLEGRGRAGFSRAVLFLPVFLFPVLPLDRKSLLLCLFLSRGRLGY